MTQSNTYNGWTNYATWRVNLEIFDGMQLEDMFGDDNTDADDIAERLKEWAEEIMENDTPDGGLARDYALAFLADVNWHEIAMHLIGDMIATDETRAHGNN